MSAASKELLDWAITLRPWQQDALRRLLEKEKLSSQDEEAILAILKAEYGISSEPPAPEPVPLTGEHLPAPGSADVVCLKAVGNVRNVNQLVGGKRLDFAPAGLTVIYGENGSGKSGYIRILRNACRSRLSSTDGKTHPSRIPSFSGSAFTCLISQYCSTETAM
jgi:ABC-type molybdenum transport system ATPase subunit/photorepair protein PhrA